VSLITAAYRKKIHNIYLKT